MIWVVLLTVYAHTGAILIREFTNRFDIRIIQVFKSLFFSFSGSGFFPFLDSRNIDEQENSMNKEC